MHKAISGYLKRTVGKLPLVHKKGQNDKAVQAISLNLPELQAKMQEMAAIGDTEAHYLAKIHWAQAYKSSS